MSRSLLGCSVWAKASPLFVRRKFPQAALPRLTWITRQILKLDRSMRDYHLPEVPVTDDVPLSTGMRIIVMFMRAFSTGGMREIGRP
jgi:hypothetical protein